MQLVMAFSLQTIKQISITHERNTAVMRLSQVSQSINVHSEWEITLKVECLSSGKQQGRRRPSENLNALLIETSCWYSECIQMWKWKMDKQENKNTLRVLVLKRKRNEHWM